MVSFDDISKLFYGESDKLESLINCIAKSELQVPKIIELYFQITNVSSISNLLKNQIRHTDEHKALLQRIDDVTYIIDKFNNDLHPLVLEQLTDSINKTMNTLKSSMSEQKSKSDIEKESQTYEELRKIMSTKEFVEQYGRGLS